MTTLVLVISALACVTATPFPDGLLTRLPVSTRDELPFSPETAMSVVEGSPRSKRESADDEGSATDSTGGLAGQSVAQDDRSSESNRENQKDPKGKNSKKSRKHKAFFLDVPFAQQIQSYSRVPSSDANYDFDTEGRNRKKYQDSNIYYIRLPPTPYSYIPGLGYISQPPTYSTAGLRPQIGHSKPPRRPAYQKPANSFINLPIDFVSNGKPTSVYQWQGSKPNKRPDSPITNLENLSAGFVSNGKPTSIYQWHSKLKPGKRPSSAVNTLDNGPYVFNGRPTSLYLLNSDGSTSAHQPIRYTDYHQQNTYY